MYGDAWERDTWIVSFLNMTDSVVAQSCSEVGFVMMDIQSCTWSIEEI